MGNYRDNDQVLWLFVIVMTVNGNFELMMIFFLNC